jgi:hexosaminidase
MIVHVAVLLILGLEFCVGSVWPQPQSIKSSGKLYYLDPANIAITTNIPDNFVIQQGIARYAKIIFLGGYSGSTPPSPVINNLNILVSNPGLPLDQNTNESYSVTVGSNAIVINAVSEYGALRGLETFSQLVVFNRTLGQFTTQDWTVNDFPRFQYRGVLMDTSRHFLHLNIIYQFLDAMAYSKFNVLHWHIVDSQSFPYVSQTFPRMAQFGAWQPYENHVYNPADVYSVLEYAKLRGIRVVPEFDTPAHCESWFVGYPQWQTVCYSGGKPNNTPGPINPILDGTYDFLTTFFAEITKVFPDTYLHLGGDELSFDCWESNPDIQAFMQQHNWGSNYSLLETYYEQKLLTIIQNLNKRYIVWEDVFDNNVKLDPRTIIGVWRSGWNNTIAKVTAAGYQTILYSPWYLNYISYGDDWTKYYSAEPLSFTGTPQQKSLVVGGTACFWGEFYDGTNLLSSAWPRASAVAERLWSAETVTDVNAAAERIQAFHCLLQLRNIPAQPPISTQPCIFEWNQVYTTPWD